MGWGIIPTAVLWEAGTGLSLTLWKARLSPLEHVLFHLLQISGDSCRPISCCDCAQSSTFLAIHNLTPVSAAYRYSGYVVIRRKEKEIRGNQELSEAHRKKKKKRRGKHFQGHWSMRGLSMWLKGISKGKVWQRPLLGLLVWLFLSRKSIILIPKTLSVLLLTVYFGSQKCIAFVTKALRNTYEKYHSLNVHVFFLLTLLKKLLPLLGRAFRALCCLNGDWNVESLAFAFFIHQLNKKTKQTKHL